MTTHTQHVVPHEGKWAVKPEGSREYTSIHASQQEAINRGREIAHRLGANLIIHEAHGRIDHTESATAAQVPARKANADQHVVPHEGQWAVMPAGSREPTSVHSLQHEAIDDARAAAKRQGTVLFVHALDGHVREQHDYAKK